MAKATDFIAMVSFSHDWFNMAIRIQAKRMREL